VKNEIFGQGIATPASPGLGYAILGRPLWHQICRIIEENDEKGTEFEQKLGLTASGTFLARSNSYFFMSIFHKGQNYEQP
jgi:hypothetical protein